MVMEFEADRMTGLKLTDEAVLPERNVVLEEQNSRVANSPSAKLGEEVQAALYLNHPYGRPVIGWRHEIEKLDRKDAIDFYNRWYTPNNAVLVVAGDVTADEVKKLAEETYGKIAPRAEIGPRMRPQEPEQRSVRTVTFADPRVTQPSLQRSYLVPSAATAQARRIRSARSAVANSRLAAPTAGSIRKLVIEKPLATSIGAWYQGTALDWTRFGVYGTPRNDVTLKDLEEAMDAVIAEVADKGVTNEELERAKIKLVADVVYAQDSQATMARWYGGALTTGLTVDTSQDLARPRAEGHRRSDVATRPRPGSTSAARLPAIWSKARPSRRRAAHDPCFARLRSASPALRVDAPLCCAAPPAQAMTKIERVVSPGGIEAWLVREPSVPLIAMEFSFKGGASQDPAGKPGVAYMMARRARRRRRRSRRRRRFSSACERNAVELSFRASRDDFRGSLKVLSARKDVGFDLLRLALTAPRFDSEPVERIRAQMLTALKRETTSPNDIGSRLWWRTAFPDHPYSRPTNGTLESVPTHSARRSDGLCRPRAGARQSQGRRGRRYRRQGTGRRARPDFRLAAGQGAVCAMCRTCGSLSVGKTLRGRARRAADRGRVRRPRHPAQGSGLHPGLHRQPYPGRRLVLVAALQRSAREARAGLFGLFLSAAARFHRRCSWAAPRPAPTRRKETVGLIEDEIKRLADERSDARKSSTRRSPIFRAPTR